jgi:succinate-semialdehyde dehydrogenase/glutarate-semialdehyde dehydrogenase
MAVVSEETFGPVLAVVRVEGVSDAIARVNRSRYGLGASLWTRDVDRAERLAERLDVGVVVINNHALTGAMPALPWSGTRDTGTGIANSHHAMLTFARPKTTLVDRSEKPELYWPPYDRGLIELGEILCDVQRGAITSAWKLPLLLHERMQRLTSFFRDAVR